MSVNGQWLSILEYSQFKDVSISSIRRYIKANRVKHKKENGKYFIFVAEEKLTPKNESTEKENLSLRLELDLMKKKIKELEEENNDLKMLVQIYEASKNNKNTTPPDLPLS